MLQTGYVCCQYLGVPSVYTVKLSHVIVQIDIVSPGCSLAADVIGDYVGVCRVPVQVLRSGSSHGTSEEEFLLRN